jgi:hypothetical protein
MKVKVMLDPERPKVGRGEVAKIARGAGMKVVRDGADFGIVVGGDGVFGKFGRTESVPLLFVGVRSDAATGSKAHLASVYLEDLGEALKDIARGRYGIVEYKRLQVTKNGARLGDVFTDVYMQRGAESNCIRYRLTVSGQGRMIREAAIGDGVVVCTRAGSTGYFSYVDKLRLGDWLDADRFTVIDSNEIGICHIVPTYTSREGVAEHPLRYTVPWGCRVELRLDRQADARLYGVGSGRGGVRVGVRDVVSVSPSRRTTKVMKVSISAG